ncbi:MAG TPA: DinB family protein [Thermomicrobiales bacterium]|nr:DinB family protein [Thermomicrobiales bacterium]
MSTTTKFPGRPAPSEHNPYYRQYIDRVPDGDLVAQFARQGAETAALLAAFDDERAQWRPAPGEWNALEIAGHLADAERLFSYRALRIARGDMTPMEGVDDVPSYVTFGNFAIRSMADVAAELAAVRQVSLAFYGSLDAAAWQRVGTADGHPISVRALAYLITGHELHHLPDLRMARDRT